MLFLRVDRAILSVVLIALIGATGFSYITLSSPLSRVQEAINNGYGFLTNNLWNDSVGGYKEIEDPTQLGNLALAYYYAWYDDPGHTPRWGWQNASIYVPSLGNYSSSNSSVIAQHFAWIKQAGLNGILVSYWDKYRAGNDTFENDTIDSILQIAGQPAYSGVKVGLMMERVVWNSTFKWSADDKSHPMNFSDPLYQNAVVSEIDYIVNGYYKPHLNVYLTFEGKPVIALYAFIDAGHQADTNEYLRFFTWLEDRVREDTGVEVSLWSLNTVDPSSTPPIFDLSAMYNPLVQRTANPQSSWPSNSTVYTTQSSVRVASIIPGYNASQLRPGDPEYGRQNGALYRQQWDDALGYDSQIELITSFNEWHESTSIEPSTEWGTQYLDLTRGLIDQLPYRTSDNQLALIFHTEYFLDQSKAHKVSAILSGRSVPNDTTNRWTPLSGDPCRFRLYNSTSYVDQMALDGIYYERCGEGSKGEAIFQRLVSPEYYNPLTGLFNDSTTHIEGHAYYKIALALVLASQLGHADWASRFANTLMSLQRVDGSWLTDDKQGALVWPNAETTLLILAGLHGYQSLYTGSTLYPALILAVAVDVTVAALTFLVLKTRYKRPRTSN